MLEELQRHEAARAAYRAALARDPDHVPALLNLAASLAGGDEEEARQLVQRALRIGVDPFEQSRLERWLAR